MYYYLRRLLFFLPRVLLHLLHIQTIRNIQMTKYNSYIAQIYVSESYFWRTMYQWHYKKKIPPRCGSCILLLFFVNYWTEEEKLVKLIAMIRELSIAETMFAVFSLIGCECVFRIYTRGGISIFFFHVGRTTVVFLSNDESGTRNFWKYDAYLLISKKWRKSYI